MKKNFIKIFFALCGSHPQKTPTPASTAFRHTPPLNAQTYLKTAPRESGSALLQNWQQLIALHEWPTLYRAILHRPIKQKARWSKYYPYEQRFLCNEFLKFFLIIFFFISLPIYAEEWLRIGVGRFPQSVTITGDEMRALELGIGVKAVFKNTMTITHKKGSLWVNGVDYKTDTLEIRTPSMLGIGRYHYHHVVEVSVRQTKKSEELLVVHPILLEEYLVGIVSSEVPASWPLEAMKAQAVAARTYALWQKYRRLELPYHMESTVLDQVYGGAAAKNPTAQEAVQQTAGHVLSFRRRLAETYFHSTCGGDRQSSENEWGNAHDYLITGPCNWCSQSNRALWNNRVSLASIKKLWPESSSWGKLKSVDVVSSPNNNEKRQRMVIWIFDKKKVTLSGVQLRQKLGYSTLFSGWITQVKVNKDYVEFSGRGSGHGVGMCQWGAKGMAEAGKPFTEILEYYYPGTSLLRYN